MLDGMYLVQFKEGGKVDSEGEKELDHINGFPFYKLTKKIDGVDQTLTIWYCREEECYRIVF